MANIKITDLTELNDPDSTDVLPIVDVGADVTKKVSVGEVVGKITGDVDVATDGTSSIASGVIVDGDVNAAAGIAGTKIDPDFGSQTVETTGVFSAAGGAEATPSIAFTGDLDTGIYSPGADQLAISTNGTGRLFIDANGNVGVGSAPTTYSLEVNGGTANTVASFISTDPTSRVLFKDDTGEAFIGCNGDDLTFYTTTSATERLRITSNGALMHLGAGNSTTPAVQFNGSAPANSLLLDASGRLLVGTSSSVGNDNQLQIYPTDNLTLAGFYAGDSSGGVSFDGFRSQGSKGSESVVSNNDGLLRLRAYGYSGAASDYVLAGSIDFEVDGTPDSGGDATDMPGRLVFSTTPSGSASPVERMRITSTGNLLVGTTVDSGSRVNVSGSVKVSSTVRANRFKSEEGIYSYRNDFGPTVDSETVRVERGKTYMVTCRCQSGALALAPYSAMYMFTTNASTTGGIGTVHDLGGDSTQFTVSVVNHDTTEVDVTITNNDFATRAFASYSIVAVNA